MGLRGCGRDENADGTQVLESKVQGLLQDALENEEGRPSESKEPLKLDF